MGLMALYAKHAISFPGQGHEVYASRVRGLPLERPNEVYAAYICYAPMDKSFM